MWQHIMYLCVRPHTTLHWKQRTHKYIICCHITHNKVILIILIGTLARNYMFSLMMICDVLSKHVGAVKVFSCK